MGSGRSPSAGMAHPQSWAGKDQRVQWQKAFRHSEGEMGAGPDHSVFRETRKLQDDLSSPNSPPPLHSLRKMKDPRGEMTRGHHLDTCHGQEGGRVRNSLGATKGQRHSCLTFLRTYSRGDGSLPQPRLGTAPGAGALPAGTCWCKTFQRMT